MLGTMLQLKHFLWYFSLSTGGILISFATFMQSLWQGLTIWPYYESTHKINELKLESFKKLLNGSRTMLHTFSGLWGFIVLISIVSSGLLIYGTMNVSLKLNKLH